MFKPRPYDPDRPDKRRPAQRAANDRNFRVFRLRGLHGNLGLLSGERRLRAQHAIDEELALLGAQTEAARRLEREAESAARFERMRAEQHAEAIAQIDAVLATVAVIFTVLTAGAQHAGNEAPPTDSTVH